MQPSQTTDVRLAQFLECRPRLFALAYRMLGSKSEAEDVLQEAYLRWHRQAPEAVESAQAWLMTTVSRLCIDNLRAHNRRQDYVGTWLPQPLYDEEEVAYACPSQTSALYESLSLAFLLLLEQLNPVERAVFLLKEIFEYSYQEIAQVVKKAPDHCRQIAHRAKARIEPASPQPLSTNKQQQQLLTVFMTCFAQGDLERLQRVLADNIVLLSDGGGKVRSVLRPLNGAERVLQFFSALKRRFKNVPTTAAPLRINGQMALMLSAGGERSLFTIETQDERITRILILRNPEKLPG
ncbi:MAG: RNA polymerase sigma factor SigJ [Hahellaceae bacterium]|nr:RNA polymerase sigma factor SigJ [Hahellaceae bacterium]